MQHHPDAGHSLRSLVHLRWLGAVTAVAGICIAGCATDSAPSGTRFIVSAASAALYKNGPAQDPQFASPQLASFRTLLPQNTAGPDTRLPKGSYVTLLRREIGYSHVVTDQGLVGYVSNDELQKAPTAITRASAVTRPARQNEPTLPRSSRPPHSRPPEDQLDLSDIPLPLPS